ncbi:MAG: 50S ribosomal protein L9 [bacterium]
MKIILQKSMVNLGREGEVIEVSRGYARNYLFPRNLALEASPSHLRELEKKRSKLDNKLKNEKEVLQNIAISLEGKEISIAMDTGEEGKLYGSVNAALIAAAIKNNLQIEIDKNKVMLHDSIKMAGEYDITIRLLADIEPRVKVKVISKA